MSHYREDNTAVSTRLPWKIGRPTRANSDDSSKLSISFLVFRFTFFPTHQIIIIQPCKLPGFPFLEKERRWGAKPEIEPFSLAPKLSQKRCTSSTRESLLTGAKRKLLCVTSTTVCASKPEPVRSSSDLVSGAAVSFSLVPSIE